MTRYIAFLRGINVGGKRKLAMTDLKQLFIDLGYTNIVTYIQSGNVIFDSASSLNIINTENKIENGILKYFNFDVPVIIRTTHELETIVKTNPFLIEPDVNIDSLYISLLKKIPPELNINETLQPTIEKDRFKIIDNNIFIFCSGQYSKSKYSNQFFEKDLKTIVTTRNWKTILKLFELLTSK